MYRAYPKRGREENDDDIRDQRTLNHRHQQCNHAVPARHEETLSDEERDGGSVCLLLRCTECGAFGFGSFVCFCSGGFGFVVFRPKVPDIRGIAEEADKVEGNADTLKYIADMETVDDIGHVGPDLPADGESDDELQERQCRSIFRSFLTDDIDDTNIDQINEELKRLHLAMLARPPQQTLVKVLPDLRPIEELQRIRAAILVLLRGIIAMDTRAVRVSSPEVRAVAELIERGV